MKNKSSNLLLPFGMNSEHTNNSSLKFSKPNKIKLIYKRDDESNGSIHSQSSINNIPKVESEKILIKVVSNSSNLNDESSTKDRGNTAFPDQILDPDGLSHLNSQPNQRIYFDPLALNLEETQKTILQGEHIKSSNESVSDMNRTNSEKPIIILNKIPKADLNKEFKTISEIEGDDKSCSNDESQNINSNKNSNK